MNMAMSAAKPSSMTGPMSYAVPERRALQFGVATLIALKIDSDDPGLSWEGDREDESQVLSCCLERDARDCWPPVPLSESWLTIMIGAAADVPIKECGNKAGKVRDEARIEVKFSKFGQ